MGDKKLSMGVFGKMMNFIIEECFMVLGEWRKGIYHRLLEWIRLVLDCYMR
jgi:hypothetical protein